MDRTIEEPSRKLRAIRCDVEGGLVPLAEGGSVDLDDGTLDQSVRLDELIVGSVVNLDQ
jgi:hypothetical protein